MPGHPAPDGRWQRGEQVAGLYLARACDTVWAEWYRALAELGEPPDLRLPRDLWRFSMNLHRVADLSRVRGAKGARPAQTPKPDGAQWPSVPGRRCTTSRPDGFRGRSVLLERPSRQPVRVRVRDRARGSPACGPRAAPERISAAPVPPRGMRT